MFDFVSHPASSDDAEGVFRERTADGCRNVRDAHTLMTPMPTTPIPEANTTDPVDTTESNSVDTTESNITDITDIDRPIQAGGATTCSYDDARRT